MRKNIGLAAAALTIAINVYSAPAEAQVARTFVSGKGTDTGTCGLATPCRGFTYALSQTAAGGEIAVLDTAGYGTVNITKSVTITAPDGIEGGITAGSGVDGIDVAAGSSDTVNLRGLVLTGGGIAHDGIHYTSGGHLNIQNCVIRNFNNEGINILPTAAGNVTVIDTVVSGNADGVAVDPSGSGLVTATFSRVSSVGNMASGFIINGFGSTGTINVTAADSLASTNGAIGIGFGVGFEVNSSAGQAVTTFTLTNSKSLNNGHSGVASQGTNAALALGQTTVAGNPIGFVIQSGGTATTFGNNQILDTGNLGTLTPLAVQ